MIGNCWLLHSQPYRLYKIFLLAQQCLWSASFLFGKQRCMFSKSNFKLRFLENKLHVCDKHSAHFSFPVCPHETKKDQRAESDTFGPSSLWLCSSGCFWNFPSLSVVCLGYPWPGEPVVSQESQILCSCCLLLCDLGGGHVTLVMMVPKRGGGSSLGERHMGENPGKCCPQSFVRKFLSGVPRTLQIS